MPPRSGVVVRLCSAILTTLPRSRITGRVAARDAQPTPERAGRGRGRQGNRREETTRRRPRERKIARSMPLDGRSSHREASRVSARSSRLPQSSRRARARLLGERSALGDERWPGVAEAHPVLQRAVPSSRRDGRPPLRPVVAHSRRTFPGTITSRVRLAGDRRESKITRRLLVLALFTCDRAGRMARE